MKHILAALEAGCLIGAAVLAILWVRQPAGNFEPPLALCTAVAVILDGARRFLRSTKLRVFVSVGATYTKAQEEYVKAFERFLTENSCERLVVGRDKPSSRQPVLQVRDLMKSADAVVVLAFTRFIVTSATEKPNADRPGHETTTIENERHPTVWNQIEAGIAFGLRRPLLVIVEEGLKQEAMLKDRLEFKAITSVVDPELFESQDFKTVFADFSRIAKWRSWLRW